MALFIFLLLAVSRADASSPGVCAKAVVTGEVSAGQEWKVAIGEGWVFRILPIQVGQAGYTGWDLVMDRVQPAGFPDALWLATPPYDSLSEREIGTTFGLRAQDAIGWNPRTFRFLTDPVEFRKAQADYLAVQQHEIPEGKGAGSKDSARTSAMARLLALQETASTGELRILEAHLTPGAGDPAPYARAWANAHTPYQIVPAPGGKSSSSGALVSMRFSLTLWLPNGWRAPASMHISQGACGR